MSQSYFAAMDDKGLIWGIGKSKDEAESDALGFMFSVDEILEMKGEWPYHTCEITENLYRHIQRNGRELSGKIWKYSEVGIIDLEEIQKK